MTEATVLRELASQIRACERNPDRSQPLFAALSLVRSLEESELPHALDIIQSCSDRLGNFQLPLYDELFAHWASFDPVEALRRVEGLPALPGRRQFGLQGVMRVWMENDLSSALAAVETAKVNERTKQHVRHIA